MPRNGDLGFGPWPKTARVPQNAPGGDPRLPKSLRPVRGEGVRQPPVFDPSLKQYPNAMRAGEPRFTDSRTGERWYAARHTALDQVLAAVAGSEWADHLVLRGSVLLRAWYGAAAREPGDLDFVVVPESWAIAEERTGRMLDGIAERAGALACPSRPSPSAGNVRILAEEAVSEDIWTYDRVPGRRLVLPWSTGDLPPGAVQLDFVWGEHLPAPPEPTRVPRADGGEPALVNAATPELSLAWKLVWLLSDAYPQGKDLYDAVLLAEHTPLRHRLLREALVIADSTYVRRTVTIDDIAGLEVDWAEFAKDYAGMPDDGSGCVMRLTAALAATFADPFEHPGDAYERHVRWHAWRIAAGRDLLAREGLGEVLRHLTGSDLAPVDAIVIVRELLGPRDHTLDEAARIVLSDHTWRGWAGYYERNPERLAADLGELHADA